MTRNRLFLVLLAAFALVSSPAWAVTAYNTTGFPSVDSLTPWSMTGTGNSSSNVFEGYGVLFTAPTVDTILTSFNIFVNAPNSGAPVALFIAGWNGGSPDLVNASSYWFSGYSTYAGQGAQVVTNPNVQLVGGADYVAFIYSGSASFGLQQQRSQSLAFNPNILGSALWNWDAAPVGTPGGTWSTTNSYFPGFNATFINSCPLQSCQLIPAAGTTPPPTITPPPPTGGGGDIPEPSTYVLLGSALLGLSILRRRSS